MAAEPGPPDTAGRQSFAVTSAGPGAAVIIQATAPGHKAIAAVILTDQNPLVAVDIPLSGRAQVLNCSASAVTLDGVAQQEPEDLGSLHLTVLPKVGEMRSLPLPARLRGLTGEHTSRNPGDGGELRDVFAFQPGDQLRRIDWRTSARRSTDQDRIFVRRTFAHSEAAVHLLIDHAFDYPAQTELWFASGQPSLGEVASLHLTREAATLLASSYLAHGDRVGLNEISGLRHPLRASAGRRQLELIRTRLAILRPAARPERLSRDIPVPTGALLYVLSPFTDDEPGRLMRSWHAAGHRVIGVDTLPVLRGGSSSKAQGLAIQLCLLQRRHSLQELDRLGIPVLGWRAETPDATAADSFPGQLPLDVGLATLRGRYARANGSAAAGMRNGSAAAGMR